MECIPIADIEIGERRREDLGDIAALAASIERYGLLHPPGVERGRKALVAGWRRLKACEVLGWTHIEVRWYHDLTDAERQAIELEEDVRRKDLTPAERAKTLVHRADTMAERFTREAQAAAEISSNDHEKSPRGRPQKPAAEAKVAAAIGVSQSALSLARQFVAAVAQYPELEGLTQREALAKAKALDALPERTREQELENLRQPPAPAAAQAGETQQRRSKTPAGAGRQQDPERFWLRAEHGLVAFLKETEDKRAVLKQAGRWSAKTLKAYRDELQRVYERVSTLMAGFDQIAAERHRMGTAVSPKSEHEGLPTVGDDTHREGTAEARGVPDALEGAARSCEDTTRMSENGSGPAPDDAQHGHSSLPAASSERDEQLDLPSRDTEGEPPVPPDHTPELADEAGDGDAGEAEDVGDRRAALVKRIQVLLREGSSWRGITKTFNAEGVPTLSGKGQWNDRSLARFAKPMGVRTGAMVDGC